MRSVWTKYLLKEEQRRLSCIIMYCEMRSVLTFFKSWFIYYLRSFEFQNLFIDRLFVSIELSINFYFIFKFIT